MKKAEDSCGVGTSKNQATVRLTEEQQQEFFKALCELGYVKDGKPMSAEFFRKCVEAVVHHYKEGDRLLLPVRFETIKAKDVAQDCRRARGGRKGLISVPASEPKSEAYGS